MGLLQGIQVGKKLKNISFHFDLFLCLALVSFDFILAMTKAA
jgi:hypothetical protein